MNRREYLATAGAAALWWPFASSSEDGDENQQRFEDFDIEVDYPHDWLQRYRPAFVTNRQTMQRAKALQGHRARHPDREHDVACYWHRLSHQDGLPLIRADEHLGDTEPCYVFVDGSGNVDRVVYTAYHHFAGVLDGLPLQQSLRERDSDEPTHVQLEIIDPWHHYLPRTDPSEARVTLVDVEGDAEASYLDTWQTRGIFDSTADEAIYDPWTVADRGSWWDESTWDYRVASMYRTISQWCDICGSDDSEVPE